MARRREVHDDVPLLAAQAALVEVAVYTVLGFKLDVVLPVDAPPAYVIAVFPSNRIG